MSNKNVKVAASVPVLRHQTERFLVGQPAQSIPGSKLPTGRDVLKFFFHVFEKCTSRQKAYKITVENVLHIWAMARINTQEYRNCVRKLDGLWKEWNELKKNKKRKRDVDDRRAQFSEKIDKLWDIGAVNAIEVIRTSRLLGQQEKEDDVKFYIDQRADRRATMSGSDKKFGERVMQQEWRQRRAERMQPDVSLPSTSTQADIEPDEMDTSDGMDEVGDHPHPCPPLRHRHTDEVKVVLPRDILKSPAILEASDRFHLSTSEVILIIINIHHKLSHYFFLCNYI